MAGVTQNQRNNNLNKHNDLDPLSNRSNQEGMNK